MIAAIILGLIFCGGVFLALAGLRPPKPPSLEEAINNPGDTAQKASLQYTLSLRQSFALSFKRIAGVTTPAESNRQPSFIVALTRRIEGMVNNSPSYGEKEKNLVLMGRTSREHQIIRLQAAIGTALAFIVFLALLIFGGILNITPLIIIVGAILGWLLGYWLPDSILNTNAKKRREEFEEAMLSWMDLTALLISTGQDANAAMVNASDISNTWPFLMINSYLRLAQLRSRPVAEGLFNLSNEKGLDCLSGFVETLLLSSEHGTEVNESIRAHIKSVRSQNIIDAEAKVEKLAEQSALPLGLVVVGFMILLAYPGIEGVTNIGSAIGG